MHDPTERAAVAVSIPTASIVGTLLTTEPMNRWCRGVIIASIAFGLIAALTTISERSSSVWAAGYAIIGWSAFGAASGAGVMLVGAAFQQIRGKRMTSADPRAARVVATIVAVGYVVGALALVRWSVDLRIMMLAGLAVGVAFASKWVVRRPTRTGAFAILAATIAVVEIPRELGWIAVTLHSTSGVARYGHQFLALEHDDHSPCRWGSEARAVHVTSALDGNVGRYVGALTLNWPDATSQEGDDIRVRIEGNVAVGWFACMVPLRKELSIDTWLSFTAERNRCRAIGTMRVQIQKTFSGIASCFAARQAIAGSVRDHVAGLARSIHKEVSADNGSHHFLPTAPRPDVN